jgi:ATP-dependent exoDNAse (exonuclease V) beta subunit
MNDGAALSRPATTPGAGDVPAGAGARTPRPVPEQAQAIEDRERDLFLAAGAGTGKTTVLVERFCAAVCAEEGDDADVGVEHVLAFTFTDRAAGELTRRIRAELGHRASGTSDAERARRLRSMARDSESAWISTIHSFCRRVLASHPIAAGLDPAFTVLDESAAARIAAEAFDAALARFGAGAGAGPGPFEMAAAYRLPELRTVVRAAHDELRSRGFDRPALPPMAAPDVAGSAAELRTAAAAALAATEAANGTERARECRSLIAAALAATEGRVPDDEQEVAGWRFKSSARALAVPEVDRYHDARSALERRLVEARFADHYDHLRDLLSLFAEEYATRKEERSALDFEDLQLRVRRLLEESATVRRRYQRQFRHVMVDEFQDTNALQLAIVRLLHEEDGVPCNRLFTVGDELQSIYRFRHADVEVFRAERLAADAVPDTTAGVRRLAGNFRSRPEVLALVNRVGRALFGPRYEELAVGRLPDEPAASGPAIEVLATEQKGWDEGETPAIEISPDERAQAWRVAEARFLADRLRALHAAGVARGDMVVLLRSYSYVEAYEDALEDAGLAPYVVGGRGYWSKQQVADVRNLLGCVANPLDERALLGALASPACGVRPDTLWLLRRAAGGATVWSALSWVFGAAPPAKADEDEREDRAQGAGARESDADGVSDPRAEWRRRAEEAAGHIPPDDAAALREFVALLDELRAVAPALSLEALIDRAITATGYDLALLMRRPRGRRRMANVRKLMRLARDFEADEGRDLRAFLDFAESESVLGGREAAAAVDAEGHDGVRLMTVHAAKGLEFPVVAVADLGRRLAAGMPPALRLEPAEDVGSGEGADGGAMRVGMRLARLGRKRVGIFEWKELEERALERDREEERRILHVAMTRAERHLVLSGAFDLEKLADEPKPTDPLIAPVLRSLGWAPGEASVELDPPRVGDGITGQLGPVRVAVRTRVPGELPADAGRFERPIASREPHPHSVPGDRPLQDPELAPPAEESPAPVRAVSYSALSLYERCGYRFYAERVLGLRPRLPSGAAAVAAADSSEAVPADSEAASPPFDGALGGARPPLGEDGGAGSEGDEWHPADDLDGLASRYARGRVVHQLLERSARDDWSAPDPLHVAELLRREGADAGQAQVRRATMLVEAFLAAPIRSELAAAGSIHAEAPFAFRVGGLVVRGEIDLLADLGREVLLVDYKSDALRGTAPTDHMARYDVQRRIYALAALRRYGRHVRVSYVFLERPDRPVEARFSPTDAPGITDELETMARGVSAGRFEVTSRPERSLCFDCPARERLCVHGPELTLRDSAG